MDVPHTALTLRNACQQPKEPDTLKRHSQMPYFELQKEDTGFPPAYFADGEGLLAVGGSMSPSLLLKAYSQGIFYWHHPMRHVQWWSPDPRIVADPVSLANAEAPELPFEFRGSANPERLLRFFQKIFNHKEQMGPSWLSERMFRIFMHLHQCGITLGLEVFLDGALVGGYFGICMGEMCYGEYAGASVAGADTAAISEIVWPS